MFMLCEPGLVYIHVSMDSWNKLHSFPDKKRVFENLVVSQNVYSLEVYERVAKAVLQIPKEIIRTISRRQFIFEFLNDEDFIDTSGKLI